MNVLVYEPLLLSLLSLYTIVNIRMINPMIVTSSNRSTFHQFTENSPWCSFTFGFSIISLLYTVSPASVCFFRMPQRLWRTGHWPFSRCGSWTIPCSKLWAGAAKAPWRFPKWGYPEIIAADHGRHSTPKSSSRHSTMAPRIETYGDDWGDNFW